MKGTTATDLMQSKDGYLNIGTYEGLVRFDGVEFTTLKRNAHNDYVFSSVRAILEDRNGNLWVGSNDDGLQMISKYDTKVYTVENGLPNNSIRALCEDKNGNIWIGTAAGVVYLTPEGHLITPQFQAGTVSKGVIAVSFYCDTAGRIWLITSNERGLFLYNDGLFCNIPQLADMENYLATSITQDLNGDFWIGLAEHGIYKLANNKLRKITTNTVIDNVSTWSIFVNIDGTIWFGS
ncbi:MAG: hypothetical protein K6G52_02525, partial [Treponemataceae bacterium]|nr:hypothetical protein [Treponemataceae bacterium]